MHDPVASAPHVKDVEGSREQNRHNVGGGGAHALVHVLVVLVVVGTLHRTVGVWLLKIEFLLILELRELWAHVRLALRLGAFLLLVS